MRYERELDQDHPSYYGDPACSTIPTRGKEELLEEK